MAKLTKKSLDGNVETLLLAVLSDGRSYGYEIVKKLNERASGLLRMGEGTVYPVLRRLEKRDLITSQWVQASSGRQRKYYKLTPRGRRALATNAQQWQSLVQLMGRILGEAGTEHISFPMISKGAAL